MLTIICIGCSKLLWRTPNRGRNATAKTVGVCCAGGYGLRQEECYRAPDQQATH